MKGNLSEAQVFTPPKITHDMLDLIGGDEVLADCENFFFEPTCGNGDMLLVIIERIYGALLRKYNGDNMKALSETLFKFYATELDPELVPVARIRVWKFAASCVGRELTELEQYIIAHQLHQAIEVRDALRESIPAIHQSPGIRALKRRALKNKSL